MESLDISTIEELQAAVQADPIDNNESIDRAIAWLQGTRIYPNDIIVRRYINGKMYHLNYKIYMDETGVCRPKFIGMNLME